MTTEKTITAEQFTIQATIDALCAQRNKALDESAQVLAQARMAAAEAEGFKNVAKTLLSAIDGNKEALDQVEDIRKALADKAE